MVGVSVIFGLNTQKNIFSLSESNQDITYIHKIIAFFPWG